MISDTEVYAKFFLPLKFTLAQSFVLKRDKNLFKNLQKNFALTERGREYEIYIMNF